MAALSITPASVLAQTGASTVGGTAGATIAQGVICYRDPADSKYKIADADSPTAAIRAGLFMALSGASNGQPIKMLRAGDVELGAAAMTIGLDYYLNDVAGEIVPRADLEAGDYVIHLGIAETATKLKFRPLNSGVAVPA